MRRLLGSLGFQVSAAFLGLGLLFAGASFYYLAAFQRQLAYDSVVGIADRLELTAERLHAEAMQYKQNAPRDYTTYYRDIRLYFQNLSANVETFDKVVDLFMSGDFRGEHADLLPWIQPQVSRQVDDAIHHLEAVWADYRAGLFAALGDDPDEPRLEYAAEHANTEHRVLNEATGRLSTDLRDWARAEQRRISQGALVIALLATLVAATLLTALYLRVLLPMRRTIQGFAEVADGDFGARLPVAGTTEIRDLTESFNRLSGRLDLLHRLLDRLQSGNDLDELTGFIGDEFRDLLRFDWIGVVSVDDAHRAARIETCRLDGRPVGGGPVLFRVSGGLVERAMRGDTPLHLADIQATVRAHPEYEFIKHLSTLGMCSAIALPLSPATQTPIPALVVFATRIPDRYDESHLRFLGNIAQLMTQSFGRTARLAERGRLAAVGEFASGIAHELRTPLSTVSMALGYMAKQTLEDRARKRIDLAVREAARMGRLLDEMLLYAKPLKLDLKPLDLATTLATFIQGDTQTQHANDLVLEVECTPVPVLADIDRLQQIFSNLSQNAREASPDGERILWKVHHQRTAQGAVVSVTNRGAQIPPAILQRMTQPFFSTKSAGTGLGLAIVRRLVEQHGGRIDILSSADGLTQVRLTFPTMPTDKS